MEYIHVKNLAKYQPGYTDRKHIWAKIYYETFLDEAVQGLCEIDRYRFWSLIVFEVYTQKPVPLTDTNLKIMGWSRGKRRIPLTLQMLHTLTEVRNTETKSSVTQSRVEESRVEESRERFTPPTIEQINQYCREKNIFVDAADFIQFYESKDWMVGKNKMKKWRSAASRAVKWEINKFRQPKPKPTEKDKVAELKAKRQKVRDDYEVYLRAKTPAALKDLLIDKKSHIYLTCHWLIKEILEERSRPQSAG